MLIVRRAHVYAFTIDFTLFVDSESIVMIEDPDVRGPLILGGSQTCVPLSSGRGKLNADRSKQSHILCDVEVR
jgi:hypothetical protein